MRSRLLALLLVVLFGRADAYVIQTDLNTVGKVVTVHWSEAQARAGIPYYVNTTSFPYPQADVVRIANASFGAWQAVPTAYISFSYQGTTTIPASSTDRRNVIIFDATGNTINVGVGSGVIALTRVNWNDQGEITDADMIFNGRDFRFSVDANNTPANEIDLQDVMTHEAGHFFGLDHTPLVGAPDVTPTMNPFNLPNAPRQERTLEQDDISAITALYPSSSASQTGGISGQVLRPDATGSFGVHVVVYRAGTSTFLSSALSGSAGSSVGLGGDGRYEILGLPPGDYNVAIEPMDPSISYQNFGGIFGHPFDSGFDKEYYDNASLQSAAKIVRVQAGLTISNIDFALGPSEPGAPYIQEADFPANTPDVNGPYPFSARITDDKGVTSVVLQYRINGGSLLVKQMAHTGIDTYSTTLPGQHAGTVIEYRLLAQDGDGHETALPTQDLPMDRMDVLVFSGAPVAYVAERNAQVLSVIDTGPGTEVARIATGLTPLSVLMTPDGRYLFVADTGASSPDNRITVIETATHRVAATLSVGDAPLDLAASPDGKLVYVTNSQSRSVSVIDVATLTERSPRFSVPTTGNGPFGLTVSPDGKLVYVTDIDANQVLVIDAVKGTVSARISVVSSPRSLVVSADGQRLYVAGFDGGIGVVNAQTQTQTQVIDTGNSSIFRVALSPDGARLYATDRLNARLLVVDTAKNQITQTLPVLSSGRETRDLFVSSDGSRVYVTNQDSNDLVVFDAKTLQVLRTFQLADGPRGVVVLNQPFVTSTGQDITAKADFDGSGTVDFGDFLLFTAAFGIPSTDARFDARFDLNGDNRVNFGDFLLFAGVFDKVVSP